MAKQLDSCLVERQVRVDQCIVALLYFAARVLLFTQRPGFGLHSYLCGFQLRLCQVVLELRDFDRCCQLLDYALQAQSLERDFLFCLFCLPGAADRLGLGFSIAPLAGMLTPTPIPVVAPSM